VGIKIGLEYTTPLRFAGIRFFLSGLYILPFAGSLAFYFKEVRKNIRVVLPIAFFQTFLLYTLFYTGIDRVPGSLAAIIIGSQPLFIALMAHGMVKNDKLTWNKVLSLLLGISGIVIITYDRFVQEMKMTAEIWGILLLVLSNLASAMGNILVSKQKGGMNTLVMNSSQLMLGGSFLFVLSLFAEGTEFGLKPSEYYISLGWLSFMSAAAFSIWFTLLKRPNVKVSVINIWKFIIPVFGTILSWVLLPDESPDFIAILGMVIIGISIILMYIRNIWNMNNRKDSFKSV
jgi:drug/metabolite transporter (DMT)-like permease